MFVITLVFFPELFAPFWLILTPIRKGSIVFKGPLHLHYILCGCHSKAIKKNTVSLCWGLPSIICFTNELLSRLFSPLTITFFPKWIFKYLFSPLSSYESKGAHRLPGFIWWQHSHKKLTFFLLVMTSNLSRDISDLHILFFYHCSILTLTYAGSIISGDLIPPYNVHYTNLKKSDSSSFSPWKLKKSLCYQLRNQLWNK